MPSSIKINGHDRSVDVEGDTPLLWALRDVLRMTGTKFGCGMGLCGACTVLVDGAATRSCITPVDSVGKSEITTVEAIGATALGAKIQRAWLDAEVVQCGYCQSGQIMSAHALRHSDVPPGKNELHEDCTPRLRVDGSAWRYRAAAGRPRRPTTLGFPAHDRYGAGRHAGW